MIGLSLVVASLLNKEHLQRLFRSLSSQVFSTPYEVLVCATNASIQDKIRVKLWAPHLDLKILSTSENNISAARNCGLKKAKGSVVFYIDEDCSLPTTDFLQKIYQFHLRHPLAAGGGYYLNTKSQSHSLDPLYNFICNTWLDRHQTSKTSAPVFLGGCSFYPREILLQENIFFDETFARAGEEYSFNHRWSQLGHPMILNKEWSVIHSPETNWAQFFKKSWIQGAMIHTSQVLPDRSLWRSAVYGFFKDRDLRAKDFPLLALYGLVGRASALNARAKKEILGFQIKRQGHNKNELLTSIKTPALVNKPVPRKMKKNRKRQSIPLTAPTKVSNLRSNLVK